MEGSVPSIVERELQRRATDVDRRFEVINTGTASYSPTIYYVLLRHVLLDYEPDLVVINIDMTDDFDDWKYLETLITDEEGNPVAVPRRNIYSAAYIDTESGPLTATLRQKVVLFLYSNSYTYHFVGRAMERVFGVNDASEPAPSPDDVAPDTYRRFSWCAYEWTEETERNVARTLDLLRRIVRLAREHDVRVMFASVPHYQQFAPAKAGAERPEWSDRPHREIARVASELGVPYLNSLEALRPLVEGTAQTDFYYAGDMHFNPRGYEAWAAAHVDFLSDPSKGVLVEPPTTQREAQSVPGGG